MPPKKKRRKREHPIVEHWTAISAVSKNLAVLYKQEQQSIALLQQIEKTTSHDLNINDVSASSILPQSPWRSVTTYSTDVRDQITRYVTWWVHTLKKEHVAAARKKQAALETLKRADVLDDEALKASAYAMTEAESQWTTLEQIRSRWIKITRCDNDNIAEHTEQWLERWLKQWDKLQDTQHARQKQFIDYHKALEPILAKTTA
jgi:hypothetical protein